MTTVVVEERQKETTAKKIAFKPEELHKTLPVYEEWYHCPYCGQLVQGKREDIRDDWTRYVGYDSAISLNHCNSVFHIRVKKLEGGESNR